jgi:hypothetical protein
MADHEDLSETLGLAFEHIKALHATLAAVMVDVAALRSVFLKGHKPSRRYREALAVEVAKVKPLVAAAMLEYEEKILIIRSGKHWRN